MRQNQLRRRRLKTDAPKSTAQIIKFYENVVIYQKLKKRFPVAMASITRLLSLSTADSLPSIK